MGNEKNNEGDKKPVGKAQAKKKTPKKTTSTSKKTSSKRAPKKAAKKITKKLTTEDMLSLMKSLEEDADLQEYKKTVRAVNSKIYEYLNSYIVRFQLISQTRQKLMIALFGMNSLISPNI